MMNALRSALTLPPLVWKRHVGQSDPVVYKPASLREFVPYTLFFNYLLSFNFLTCFSPLPVFFSEIK